jgi:hypothetical protein
MNVTPWDGKPISAPGVYSGVPMSVYHSADLCVGPSISSSGLRTIFDPSQGPMAYWVYSPMNPMRQERPDSEAFILGRAAHHLFLGEADFGRHFTVEPETYPDAKTGQPKPWSNNSNFAKEWHAHVASEGLTVLSRKQLDQIKGMAGVLPWQKGLEDSGLANNAVVGAGALKGLIEHSIIARDEETGVWLKSRPDVIPTGSLEFNDFKTSGDVSDEAIRKTLDNYRYDMQADLASVCLEQAAGQRFESHAFIFASKTVPHATNVAELDADDLGEAAKDNRIALRTFARCIDTGRWPGPAGTRGDAAVIGRSLWNRTRAADRRAYLERELAA